MFMDAIWKLWMKNKTQKSMFILVIDPPNHLLGSLSYFWIIRILAFSCFSQGIKGIEVIKVHVHKKNVTYSDVALMKLKTPLDYSLGIMPICLPEEVKYKIKCNYSVGHKPDNILFLGRLSRWHWSEYRSLYIRIQFSFSQKSFLQRQVYYSLRNWGS